MTFLSEDSGEESDVSGEESDGSGEESDVSGEESDDSGVVSSDSGVVSGGSGVESDDSGVESGYPDLVPTSVPAGEGRGVPPVPLIVAGGLVLLAGAAARRHGEVRIG